jgi:hypothetical protein
MYDHRARVPATPVVDDVIGRRPALRTFGTPQRYPSSGSASTGALNESPDD